MALSQRAVAVAVVWVGVEDPAAAEGQTILHPWLADRALSAKAIMAEPALALAHLQIVALGAVVAQEPLAPMEVRRAMAAMVFS